MAHRSLLVLGNWVLSVGLAGVLLAGCNSSRATGCCATSSACAVPCATPCAVPACPCPAPEPSCSPCGPRPAHAKAGEAWCCVYMPPVDTTVCDQVCVKPASSRCVWVPPTYGTRIKVVCEAEARIDERTRPGVYAVQRRDVLVKPSSERVRPICCPPGDLAPGERQCECLIKEETPAVWGEECSRVCLEPERLCVEYTPPVYRCVEERYEISPGFTERVCEPAVYESRSRTVCAVPGRWEWRLNEACKVPVQLEALQVEMVDSNPDGTKAGIFKVGSQVRYDVTISSDTAGGTMEGLTVSFQLPPELEFVSGSAGGGVTLSGAGQSAVSTAFSLAGEKSMKMYILATVKSAPAKELLQVTAVVRSAAGAELATDSESSSVPNLK